jgi:Na+/H+-translocating membrane pyrophosphatase
MELPMIIALICGGIGLGIAGFMARYVLKQDQGSERIRQISAAIKEGALAFIRRESSSWSLLSSVSSPCSAGGYR